MSLQRHWLHGAASSWPAGNTSCSGWRSVGVTYRTAQDTPFRWTDGSRLLRNVCAYLIDNMATGPIRPQCFTAVFTFITKTRHQCCQWTADSAKADKQLRLYGGTWRYVTFGTKPQHVSVRTVTVQPSPLHLGLELASFHKTEHAAFHRDYKEASEKCINGNGCVVQIRAGWTHIWDQRKTNVDALPICSSELLMNTQHKDTRNATWSTPPVTVLRKTNPTHELPPISSRSNLVVSSHLRRGPPSNLFPSGSPWEPCV
jgi:hypothetical protein